MKIGFIGAGNMGSALARAIARVCYVDALIYDLSGEKAAALASDIAGRAVELGECAEADVVFLGVKPHHIKDVAASIKDYVSPNTVIITMAAGIAISKLTDILGEGAKIIRIMPNTPVAYGKGMILCSVSEAVDENDLSSFRDYMKYAGRLDLIPESLIDAGSAVSGCGPAFVYMFIEALADGGVAAGLTRDRAMQYAAETVIGAATVVLESGKHPGELKDAVCSPGGSTIEGVLTLEAGSMRGVVADAVLSSYEKTKMLGK